MPMSMHSLSKKKQLWQWKWILQNRYKLHFQYWYVRKVPSAEINEINAIKSVKLDY